MATSKVLPLPPLLLSSVAAYNALQMTPMYSNKQVSEEISSISESDIASVLEDFSIPTLYAILSLPSNSSEQYPLLYSTVPAIQKFLALSAFFPEQSRQYLARESTQANKEKMRFLLLEACCRMEQNASHQVAKILRTRSDSFCYELIENLSKESLPLKEPAIEFERIVNLRSERAIAYECTRNESNILFIGCGALSLSGLSFAAYGAHVTLVDIDPRAIESFERFRPYLPFSLQERISTRLVVKDDYSYLQESNFSVIALAAQVFGKQAILDSIKKLSGKKTAPIVFIRTPKLSLFEMMYFPLPIDDKNLILRTFSERSINCFNTSRFLQFPKPIIDTNIQQGLNESIADPVFA